MSENLSISEWLFYNLGSTNRKKINENLEKEVPGNVVVYIGLGFVATGFGKWSDIDRYISYLSLFIKRMDYVVLVITFVGCGDKGFR